MSERHQEGLAHLLFGISSDSGGFIALTGEVGTGKTTLCRCLLQQLPEQVEIALIFNPKLNAIELLAAICDELGIAYPQATDSLKHLVDALNRHLLAAHARGRRTVLLIDEAQNLSLEVLEQIRLLTNLETTKAKLLQIILVGQPELKQLLERQELRQLNQRITARYHLLPLSFAETKAYIRHRLTLSQGDPGLFTPGAIRRIYRKSRGIPRLINILCDRALLGAYANQQKTVDAKTVDKAAQETLPSAKNRSVFRVAVWALVMLAIVGYSFNLHRPVHNKLILSGRLPQPPSEPAAPPIEAKATQPGLSSLPADAGLSLAVATAKLLALWHKPVPASGAADCDNAVASGLQCLFDKTDWQSLIALDRPAVLELTVATGGKRYLLLTGIDNDRAIIQAHETFSLPILELLKHWHGYYLVLWQPPKPGVTEIKPGEHSANVLWLRQQLHAEGSGKATDWFDDDLRKHLSVFQQQHHLVADGLAGGRTLIHLGNLAGAPDSPKLTVTRGE